MKRKCDMEKCWYVKTVKQYEQFYTELQKIRQGTVNNAFMVRVRKLMDEFEHIAEEHAPLPEGNSSEEPKVS